MNIAIYGAGSMGTVLGAFLCRTGCAPDLISRDQAHIEALKTGGAAIGGAVSFSTPPFDGRDGRGCALLPSQVYKKYDIVFILTKQKDNAAAADMLKEIIAPDGVYCTMQNGIPEPALAQLLGKERILGCICIWGASKTAAGMADLTSDAGCMRFFLGGLTGVSHPMLANVQAILAKICPVSIERNLAGTRWSKLLINAAFSGISAVTGYNFGQVAANRRSNNYALHIMKECLEVCRAAGIAIEPVQGKFPPWFLYFNNPLKKFFLSLIMPITIKNHRNIKSGMLYDLDRRRPCDIEAINGEICRLGKAHNVATPYNDRIVGMVHAIERGALSYSPDNITHNAIDSFAADIYT